VLQAVRILVQQYFVPHGICAGSEKQGGQHEHDGGKPVLAPVNFVITMTVDGKNIDLVNYWYGTSTLAGDELIFRLEEKKVNATFNLSSYYKQPVSQLVQTQCECWQLVPDTLRQETDAQVCTVENAWKHHQSLGYWRIAQTFQKRDKNNLASFQQGMPLEVTFAPVWQSFASCRDVVAHGDHEVTATVKHLKSDDPKKLYSVANRDSLKFIYEPDKDSTFAFTMTSSQNHYTIVFDKKVCQVYLDGGQVPSGTSISKDTRCLHVLFYEKDTPNVQQTYKAHKKEPIEKKDNESVDDLKTYESVSPCTHAFRTTIKEHTVTSGIVGEYIVNIAISHEEGHFFDADFLRCWAEDLDWFRLAGDFWCVQAKDYVHATDKTQVLVEYVPKPKASRASSAASSQLTSRSVVSDAPLHEHAHVADFSVLSALAPPDDGEAQPKAPKRMKKIKFSLLPDAADAGHGAGE